MQRTFPEGLDPSVSHANSCLGGKKAVGPLNSESMRGPDADSCVHQPLDL